AEKSPAFWAFRAFRNFDGKGGHFLDWSVPVKGQATLASLFGSRDADGQHVVAVLLNMAAYSALSAKITLAGCNASPPASAFTYTPGAGGFTRRELTVGDQQQLATQVAPYSITVLDLKPGQSRQ